MEKNIFNPTQSMHSQSGSEPQVRQIGRRSKGSRSFHKTFWFKLIVVAVILAILVGGGIWLLLDKYQQATGSTTVNSKEYQAVFLTNGQVYFGKLDTVSQYYLKLTDIYYLQVQQSVQPSTTSPSSASNSSSGGSNNVQLVKLGNELHGPEDEMSINRQQVLFWENLKPSGKVTQAIDQYQHK